MIKPINPYPGPKPIQIGEAIYGRDRELRELLDTVIAERIVLVHSPSGAGKTSLLQAGLIPRLKEEQFFVFPLIRVGWPLEKLKTTNLSNRYLASVLASLQIGNREGIEEAQSSVNFNLHEYLTQAGVESHSQFSVLIFDQFEEILTADPLDKTKKIEFFEQLGEALEDRHRWAIFAMREEFVAALDPFLTDFPTHLETRFQLNLLNKDQAIDAIQKPADIAGVEFTDGAANKLIDDLRVIKIKHPGEDVREEKGDYVEPLHLQLACNQIWEKLEPDQKLIVERQIQAVGEIDQALSNYYTTKVTELATDSQTRVDERVIRDWFETQLITSLGVRGQSLCLPGEISGSNPSQASEAGAGGTKRLRKLLVDSYLVREENRRGVTWFELSHDRLIGPIKENNEAWRDAHLSLFQREASSWESQGRPEGKLLTGDALADAEIWATSHDGEMTQAEHDFLAVCVRTRDVAKKEKQRDRLVRNLYVALAGFFIFTTGAVLYFAVSQWTEHRPWGKFVGLSTGSVHPLKGSSTTVGRSTESRKNAINFAPTMVSRLHLLLTRDLAIFDMRSMNGTSVNGKFLLYGDDRKLAEDDVVVLGDLAPIRFKSIKYGAFDLRSPSLENEPVPTAWGILIDGTTKDVHYLLASEHFLALGKQGEVVASENRSNSDFLRIAKAPPVTMKDGTSLVPFTVTKLTLDAPVWAEMKLGDYTYGKCLLLHHKEVDHIQYHWGSANCALTQSRKDFVEKGREYHGAFQVIYDYKGSRFRIIPIVQALEGDSNEKLAKN